MPEPPNVKDIQDVVRLLVTQPAAASTFGPITDLLVQEKFLKQRNGAEWLGKLFPYTNLRDRVSLVHEYLRILRSIDAVPELLFSERAKKADVTEDSKSEVPPTGSAPVGPNEGAPLASSTGLPEESASSEKNNKDNPAAVGPLFESGTKGSAFS